MFNTYTNSLLWSKGYQTHCSSLLSHRSESYKLSSCCCVITSRSCCCCFVKPKVTINPGFLLYGLRQSHLPSFRTRLLVGCTCSRRNNGFRVRACEEECGSDDVEAMISFLSEELIEEKRNVSKVSVVGRDTSCKGRLIRRNELEGVKRREGYREDVRKVNVEGSRDTNGNGNGRVSRKKKNEGFGREEFRRNGVREDVRLEEINGCEHCGRIKKDSKVESDYRRGSKLVTGDDEYVGNAYRGKEEREVGPRRTKSSSCSSYYSLGSTGDFESDEYDEDVEFHRENLRKSEKKFVEQSTSGTKSRKEASQMHLRRKKDERVNGAGSSYRKQDFEEEGTSNQGLTLNRRRRERFSQTGSRVSESLGNYEEDVEIHEVHVNDEETNSQNQKIFSGREDNRVHTIRTDSGNENVETSEQLLKERLDTRYSSEERVSEMRRRTNYSSNQEESMKVPTNFPEVTINQQPRVEERISNEASMRMSTERLSQHSEIHNTNIRNTYVLQSEDRTRNQEVDAGLVSGLQSEGKQQDYHVEQSPFLNRQSDRTSVSVSHTSDAVRYTEINRITENNRLIGQGSTTTVQSEGKQQDYHIEQSPFQNRQSDRTSVSGSHTSDAVRYTEINRISEKRLIDQGSTTIVQSDGNKAEKSGAWKDSWQDHANATREGQMALRLQRSQEKLSQEATNSQSPSTFVSGNRTQLVDMVSEEMQGSETTLIPPSSQLVSRGSGRNYGTGGVSILEVSDGTSETGYPAFENPGAGAFVSSQSAGEVMRFTTHGDALGSAQRLEQASEKLVEEFVKKAKHEASTSQTEERIAETNQLKRRDSKRTSSGSGAKGPSEEMWVTDSAQGTPQPGASEGNAAEGNVAFKRNGRSLWSVIGDIARLRWGTRAGSPDSSAKPAGKSSPNESVSSAAWFSGREHDGSSDDNKKGDRVSPPEAASPMSQFEPSNATKLKQQSGRHEGVVLPPSSTILESGSASYRMSSTSGDQIVGTDEEEGRDFEFRVSETSSIGGPIRLPSQNLKRSPAIKEPSEPSPTEVPEIVTLGERRRYQARVPETDAVQKPLPFPGRNLRSPIIKEPSPSRPTTVSGSSSLREQVEKQQPLRAKSEGDTSSTPADSSLIQRKLQRNKQVVRDSFEEWEDAYRVDAERRTADELFMREALVEAKKAADVWEVPVGAVLVHDGKIIARGYNLVEDLRDSTAHAEMICIREGSKVLRSWRLADTTLYVTLEPCPMCAGAILQARVKTLVWGAPNKLLGADGSWIRLFPGGEGNGSEVLEKPPPPVHPFHPNMTIRRGVLESECAQTMQQFFQLRRKKKDKNSDPSASTDHHHHLHPSKLLNKMHQVLPFFCL